MKIEADSPEEYITKVPEKRIAAIQRLRETIKQNLPEGFEETMSYGMIGYVIPHSKYPAGYHCNPSLPLPFMNIASQKNFLAIYHFGIYANQDLYDWFVNEYKKAMGKKPDMGKSCIRFKNPDLIPFELIGELSRKMSPEEMIESYESNIRKK
jgi:uncharacterized protein YdhG (YjbR/CyaY superfamily)